MGWNCTSYLLLKFKENSLRKTLLMWILKGNLRDIDVANLPVWCTQKSQVCRERYSSLSTLSLRERNQNIDKNICKKWLSQVSYIGWKSGDVVWEGKHLHTHTIDMDKNRITCAHCGKKNVIMSHSLQLSKHKNNI